MRFDFEESTKELYGLKTPWRFILFDDDGLDFCTSIWFASKRACAGYMEQIVGDRCVW